MAVHNYYVVILVLYFTSLSEAQVVFIEKQDEDTKTLQVLDKNDNTLIRTQFLPNNQEHDAENTPLLMCDDTPEKEAKFRNSTYEIKNGKLYRITRVKKKSSKRQCVERTNNRVADRRQWDRVGEPPEKQLNVFQKLFPNLNAPKEHRNVPRQIGNAIFSVLPQLSGGSSGSFENSPGESTKKNDDRSWQFWAGSHPITSNALAGKKEKLQKLLNLFTIVQFDNEGCLGDGLKGTCYHQAECAEKGGQPIGPCARGYGVCCYIERTCGQQTNENCTYFVNDGFPAVTSGGANICALTVQKAHSDVRQLRLEFQTFELQGPVEGTCMMDRFLVTGQNRNSIVPELCGVNTGQHMYVDVDDVSGPVSLNVVTMGQEPGRKWRVKVTQLTSTSELLAPRNCLQYYTDLSGTIESFNYQQALSGNVAEAAPGYFNNLNYDVCVKKGNSFCSVTYTNEQAGEIDSPFQLINMNSDGEVIIPRGQAGAEIFNCPDDYIVINGVRLCGERLNDATIELDYTKNAPVTDLSAGPAQLTVKTDSTNVSRGFRLLYKQNPCLDAKK